MPRLPRFETMCPSCDEMVGVWNTPWNQRPGDPRTTVGAGVPKVSRHKGPCGGVCPGSLLAVPASIVMEAAR